MLERVWCCLWNWDQAKMVTLLHISQLTYPLTPQRKIEVTICNHQDDSPFYVWPDVWCGICKLKKKYGHTWPNVLNWDQVSLNNSNQTLSQYERNYDVTHKMWINHSMHHVSCVGNETKRQITSRHDTTRCHDKCICVNTGIMFLIARWATVPYSEPWHQIILNVWLVIN